MDKFELAVGAAAVVAVALVLSGFWSVVHYPHCGVLVGYMALGASVGFLFLLGGRYRQLETWGALAAFLFLLVMWYTYANWGVLLGC